MTLSRGGSTLIELLATLALMAIVASVVTLAFRAEAPQPANDPYARVLQARMQAVRTRQAVTIDVAIDDDSLDASETVTALPDGEVLATPLLPFDRLTGERSDTLARARR